jgi:hypothetical protein
MLTINIRLAEIWELQRKRDLTEAEELELKQCLQANASYVRKRSEFLNWMYVASLTKDIEEEAKYAAEIIKLDMKYTASVV